MNHTQGPWEVIEKDKRISIRKVETHDSVVFRLDSGSGFKHETNMANARLIAAAPELLAAIHDYLGHTTGAMSAAGNASVARLFAVIDKAEGKK